MLNSSRPISERSGARRSAALALQGVVGLVDRQAHAGKADGLDMAVGGGVDRRLPRSGSVDFQSLKKPWRLILPAGSLSKETLAD
jgi:hypothetical protein